MLQTVTKRETALMQTTVEFYLHVHHSLKYCDNNMIHPMDDASYQFRYIIWPE